MNKFYKSLSALFLAIAVFTVNIPMESVYALNLIKFTEGTETEDEEDETEDEEDEDDTDVDNGEHGEILPGNLSFEVSSSDTGSSKTVFSDSTFSIFVKNSSTNENVDYVWHVSPDDGNYETRDGDDEHGSTIIFSNVPSGTLKYTVYVIGTYEILSDPANNTLTSTTVKSSEFEIEIISRPDLNPTIAPESSSYAVGTVNLNDIYVTISDTYDFNKASVEWTRSSGLVGDEYDESDQNKFFFAPNNSITEEAGTYTISAKVSYDHDNNSSTADAYVSTTNTATIEVYDETNPKIAITGETSFTAAAIGNSLLTATLSGGISESDLIGGEYLWTLDGETLTGETGASITINISSLSATQVYTVSASYIDKEGNVQTLTDSVTVTKGSITGDEDGDTDGDTDGDSDSGGDSDSDNGQTGDGSAYPQFLSDLTIASKVYVQNRAASPLEVSVDPRIDGTISYKWYVNNVYSTIGGTLLNYEYGITGNTTSITPSVTPSTDTVGTFYYYVEVTNHYGEFTKTTRSNVATIQVIADDTAPTKYTVNSTGKMEVADYSKIVVDWSTFDEFIDDGGEVLYVTGSYIQNLRVPAVYSTNGYEVTVVDEGYGLEYTWKIKDGSQVSGYLDLAVSTATSLSGVDKGNSALNYDARYSEILEFKHEGALTNNDKGITLSIATTVKDGDGHLNKLNEDGSIDYNTYVKGSIDDGILTVNMKECSDWVVSALKLAALSDYDNSNGTGALTGFMNIPTFVGFEISEFKNVVVGQMIYLDKINMDTIDNNRFVGWYYDTAFLEQVATSDVNSGMLVTREIVTNGLYPKYEKSNSYYPVVNTGVPATGNSINTYKLESLF